MTANFYLYWNKLTLLFDFPERRSGKKLDCSFNTDI